MSEANIRVHLAEADYLARLGLERLLGEIDYVELGAISTTGTEAIEAARADAPDILLIEASVKDVSSLDVAKVATESWPDTRVVMLSSSYSLECIVKAHQAGAKGYLAKSAIADDLGPALRMIHRGEVIFSLPHGLTGFPPPAQFEQGVRQEVLSNLRKEERQTLYRLASGMTNMQIAAAMLCSEATVKARISQIMVTLRVGNRVQLAVLAARAGVLDTTEWSNVMPNRPALSVT